MTSEQMVMTNWQSEDEIRTELRRLAEQIRSLRSEFTHTPRPTSPAGTVKEEPSWKPERDTPRSPRKSR